MEEEIKKIVEAPAHILDKTVKTGEKAVFDVEHKTRINRLKDYAQTMGPGIITGSSGNDPSGIATYSQTGAEFGYHQLWLALISFPLQSAVQEMCARIGMVTGEGLTEIIKKSYAKPIVITAVLFLAVANIITIGADIGAMADATRLLVPQIPFPTALLGFIIISLLLQIYLEYRIYANYLKYLTFTLVAYVFTALMVKQDWSQVLRFSILPSIELKRPFLLNVVAILGTTITPYMYFWQTSQAVEEEIKMGLTPEERHGTTKKALRLMRFDVIFGMFFSNLIMWFIILTAAATLAQHNITTVETAAQAAAALKPFAGSAAYALFTMGIIGAGLLAVPVLAGATAYAVSALFGWKQGLHLKLKKGYSFYGLIILSVLLGSTINFVGIGPIRLLYYAAVVNGLIAAPLVFLIIRICNNKELMNGRSNGLLANIWGYITVFLMGISALLLILSFIGLI